MHGQWVALFRSAILNSIDWSALGPRHTHAGIIVGCGSRIQHVDTDTWSTSTNTSRDSLRRSIRTDNHKTHWTLNLCSDGMWPVPLSAWSLRREDYACQRSCQPMPMLTDIAVMSVFDISCLPICIIMGMTEYFCKWTGLNYELLHRCQWSSWLCAHLLYYPHLCTATALWMICVPNLPGLPWLRGGEKKCPPDRLGARNSESWAVSPLPETS
jgi:hypothetical protein